LVSDSLRIRVACLIEALAADAAERVSRAEQMVIEAISLRENAAVQMEYAAELARVLAEKLDYE
jgi:hypothetical protein